MKTARILILLLTLGLVVANCGGGKSATILGPDGTEVTSIDASTPVAANIQGLAKNTQYRVSVRDANGTEICQSSVFTDGSGAIPASPYCYIRDRLTSRWIADGRVDTKLTAQNSEVWGLAARVDALTTLVTGDYTLAVLDSGGGEVLTKMFAVTTDAARACASNAAGMCARSFLKTASNVYVTIEQGTGITDGSVVDIYVVADRCGFGFAAGTALQDVSGGAATGVTVNYTGGVFTTATPVWANPANPGIYDVVIDVDRSGTYTAGDVVEIMDPTPSDANNPGGLCGVGFTVQDAYSTGSHVIMQIAMDKNRAYQDIFSKSRMEDVYAQVQSQRRLVHKFGVRKYVVVHKDTWTDGDTLTDVIDPTIDEVQTGCTNQQRRLIAPINLLEPGCYDVIFDVDGDGVYDQGGDAIDNVDLSGASTCGFIVADDSLSVTIATVTDVDGTDVKDGTSDSVSSKVTITGTATGFTAAAVVKAYAVSGSQQSGTIIGAVTADGTFAIPSMTLFSGSNTIKVQVYEGLGTADAKYASATATVTWNPGGASGAIDFYATITWLTGTDMDTHFIKTGGNYTLETETNYTDCHYTNCSQASNEALNWTTVPGTQAMSSDTDTGAIARLDLDCIGCATRTENVWIKDMSAVVAKAGKFLLCVVAYDGSDTPSAQVSLKGVGQLPLTATSPIDDLGGDRMWYVGYVTQDASGNLSWTAVNQTGAEGICAP